MIALSLVMPVYNVARYLPACLESLAAMLPQADEIIAVDDGSTDECPAILDAWRQRLPQMRIVRQENAGLSAARNTGIQLATGKWLAFVDSDDMVFPAAHGRLAAIAEADDLDMAVMNAEYHFEGRDRDYVIYADVPPSPVTAGAEWLKERLRAGGFLHMVWMHLYRRRFLELQQLHFIPGRIHEDVLWTTKALLAARRMRYDDRPGYRYRIPVRTFSPEQKQTRLENIIASSIGNTCALAQLADGVADAELRRLLRADFVDRAFSTFHKAEQLPADSRCRHLAAMRAGGYYRLLWLNAQGWRQRRRVASAYLRGLVRR
jgi:heptose III glucuronosyltransferase